MSLKFPHEEFKERLRRFRTALLSHNLVAAIVTNWQNLYYFLGITTMYTRSRFYKPMPLIIGCDDDEIFFVPTKQFSTVVEHEYPYIINVQPYNGLHPWKTVAEVIKQLGFKNTIAVENDDLRVGSMFILKKILPNVRFTDCTPLINRIRSIKSPLEHIFIKKSCEITDRVLDRVSLGSLKPGKTELEVAGEIIKALIDEGAEDASFYPQVISGNRSAHLNVSSSHKIIERGEIIMLDFGANFYGYCSDTARPALLGRIPSTEEEKACEAAYEIMNEALKEVKAGIKAYEVHKSAIAKAQELGYEKNLRHSSGHGIGLDVWEPPYLDWYDTTILEEGMTLAVEQGIYFKKFGVRFEQNIIVKHSGYEQLFNSKLSLIQV